jgi:NAD(P)-dependent dehydrogenase (short-subunit alcohol dehydrogenase family)
MPARKPTSTPPAGRSTSVSGAAYTAAKHAATHLRPGGSIVLSTGIAGARPEPNYRRSPAGAELDGCTRSEACRWVALGGMPVGRVGEVSDIAETFLYLMRNGYSSGTIVTVDGSSVRV